MISDDIFKKELEKQLKTQGLKKSDRKEIIKSYFTMSIESRDQILSKEHSAAQNKSSLQ